VNRIMERLDKLRDRMQEPDFLNGKGLSNEVNIHIFCYDAEDEMVVLHFLKQITTDQALNCHLIECNLYETFLSVCADIDIINSIPEMEESDGGSFLLEQLHSAVGESEFISKIQENGPCMNGDVLLLTGVGDAFPFMRVHKMLEALQPFYSNVPILVMYPGTYDGSYLRLFNKLKPNPYYRAFNMIQGGKQNDDSRHVL